MVGTKTNEGSVDLPGLNYRNVTIKTYKDDTAYSKSDEYEYDKLLAEGMQHSWHSVDGVRYSSSFCNVP
jgi:hypothetical protein